MTDKKVKTKVIKLVFLGECDAKNEGFQFITGSISQLTDEDIVTLIKVDLTLTKKDIDN